MDCLQRQRKPKVGSTPREDDQSSGAASDSDTSTLRSGIRARVAHDAATLACRDTEFDALDATLPILPKGIVGNTSEIYAEVASFDVIPAEKLCKYWRVYTVTHRKLYDPTANRLENFWWHIWGSSLRQLSGKTVARLYKHISTDPTFVPLRVPLTRYDGPTIKFPQTSSAGRLEKKPARQDVSGINANGDKRNPTSAEVTIDPAPSEVPETAKISTNKSVNALDSKYSRTDTKLLGNASSTIGETHGVLQQNGQIGLPLSYPSRLVTAPSVLPKQEPLALDPCLTPQSALPLDETETNANAGESTEELSDATITRELDSGTDNDTSEFKHLKSKPAADASTSETKIKASAGKRDASKRGTMNASRKKFVVNVGTSKRRTVVTKRSGPQGSQSSGASDRPVLRTESSPYLPVRQPVDSLHNIEKETGVLISTKADSHISAGSVLTTTQNLESRPHLQAPAISDKRAGKRPARLLSCVQREPDPVPALDESAVHSALVPATGLDIGTAVATSVPAIATQTAPLSRTHHVVGFSTEPERPAVSDDLPGFEEPGIVRRMQPNATRKPAEIVRPGGGLIRQTTSPYEMGQRHRQQLNQMGPSKVMQSSGVSGPVSASFSSAHHDPGSGSGSGAAPLLPAARISAPQMGRSMSQDSYVVKSRVSYRSPILGPMRSPTVAAPSMVAASGIFLDGEGPDPFELYARTGLDCGLGDDDDREPTPYMPENRSYGASFQSLLSLHYSSSFQSPSTLSDTQPPLQKPLFSPTPPTPTPRIPFARTRSQLNVILGREKERLGENSYASWQESRGAKDQAGQHR